MTETVWIELIRTLPTFGWIAFAFAALIIGRRLLFRESHRIDKVESPFVSLQFAQTAIEENRLRAAEEDAESPTPGAVDGPVDGRADPEADALGHGPPGRPSRAQREQSRIAADRLVDSIDVLRGGSLLWVDDHPEWNRSMVRLFRAAGLNVDTAASTDEALRAMGEWTYDVVVTDMRRDGEPDGDRAGTALLDRMVADGVPSPAIVFSGTAADIGVVHPRAAATTDSPEALVIDVIDVLRNRRRIAPARVPWARR